MSGDQFQTCDASERLSHVEQAMTDIQAANRTWGVAISGILGGAAVIAVPFLFWMSSSVSAHETAINVVQTKMDNQEAKISDMAQDIKSILAELRKKP